MKVEFKEQKQGRSIPNGSQIFEGTSGAEKLELVEVGAETGTIIMSRKGNGRADARSRRE